MPGGCWPEPGGSGPGVSMEGRRYGLSHPTSPACTLRVVRVEPDRPSICPDRSRHRCILNHMAWSGCERLPRDGELACLRRPTHQRRADMAQESPSDSTTPPAEGRRLGGGAIASLSGVALLVIFMIQNTTRPARLPVLEFHLAALAPHCGVGAARGVGVVRIGRDAPSSASQGAPPCDGTDAHQRSSPSRTVTTLPGSNPSAPPSQIRWSECPCPESMNAAVRGMCQ